MEESFICSAGSCVVVDITVTLSRTHPEAGPSSHCAEAYTGAHDHVTPRDGLRSSCGDRSVPRLHLHAVHMLHVLGLFTCAWFLFLM